MLPQRPAQPPRSPAVRSQRQYFCYVRVARGAAERFIKDEAEELRPPVLGPLGNVRSGEENCARIDVKRSGNSIEQGGFPRTIRADDDYKRSIIYRQLDRLQCLAFIGRARIECLADPTDFKHAMIGA